MEKTMTQSNKAEIIAAQMADALESIANMPVADTLDLPSMKTLVCEYNHALTMAADALEAYRLWTGEGAAE
jgi:hypothetical protein